MGAEISVWILVRDPRLLAFEGLGNIEPLSGPSAAG